MEFFEKPALKSDKPDMMSWLYDMISHELEMAFIKAPGVDYFETYVTVAAFFVLLWIIASNMRVVCDTYVCRKKKYEENIHLTLLKDDLIKCAPFKRNPKGQIKNDSLIKLHGIIFKHS